MHHKKWLELWRHDFITGEGISQWLPSLRFSFSSQPLLYFSPSPIAYPFSSPVHFLRFHPVGHNGQYGGTSWASPAGYGRSPTANGFHNFKHMHQKRRMSSCIFLSIWNATKMPSVCRPVMLSKQFWKMCCMMKPKLNYKFWPGPFTPFIHCAQGQLHPLRLG